MASLPIAKTSADSSVQSPTTRSNFACVYWLDPVTVGDTLVLQDGSGNTAVSLRCEVAGQSQLFEIYGGIQMTGYKLSTISSGTAYLYFQ